MTQCYCMYSGVSFKVEGFSHKMEIQCIHPIFNLPLSRLLQRSGDWARDAMSKNEERLFFLALLHNTDLVHFEATAQPSHKLIIQNMEALIKFINWRKGVGAATFKLPEFMINHANRYLTNVATWIRVWNDIKDEWYKGSQLRELKKKLSTSEEALTRLMHSSFKSTEDYAGKLARWAMDAADVPGNLRDHWTKLFKLKGMDLYGADWFTSADLEELREHMETHLDIYNAPLHVNTVLQHVRTLEAKNKAGIHYCLGFNLDNDSLSSDAMDDAVYSLTNTSFTIIDEADKIQEQTKAAMIAAYAPATNTDSPPKLEDYPSKVAWLRAKAAWSMVKKEQ